MGNAEEKTNDSNESFLDELAPGTELLRGQYKIDKFLNSGGFGITYLASDSLARKVVIKECFPSSFCNRSRAIVQARSRAHTAELQSVVQLFVQEARSLAKLNHPNIVGVHQVFEDNETAYMVLDFVEGRDLLDTLEDGDHGLTPPQIKGILKDVLSAVQFIHSQDILHRDISPDNILLDADMRPVLIDFGAAREEATKKSRVLSAMRVVKDGYSPQEFYIQGSEQTPSSDLYALGATFHHLIAGEIPPNSQSRLAAIASGDPDPYQPLVGRLKGYDSKFLGAIDKALGILPKDRMQSAEDWLDAMEGRRQKSRVVTMQAPISSAAAATQVAEKRSAFVPLMGSVAVVAVLAVGGMAYTGKLFPADDAETTTAVAPISNISSTATETAQATPSDAVETPVIEVPATEVAEAEPKIDVTPAPVEVTPAPVETAEAAPTAENTPEVATTDEVTDPAAIDVAEAPQPQIAETPEVPGTQPEAIEAPTIASEITPTLRPRAKPTVQVAEAPAQDGLESVEIAEQDIAAPLPSPVEVAEAEVTPSVDEVATSTVDPSPAAVAQATPPADTSLADTSIVKTQMLFDLPFDGELNTNVISKAANVAPLWVRPGVEVLAVNDLKVDKISEIEGIIAGLTSDVDAETKQVSFTVKPEGEEIAQVESWTMPVKHETSLPNGTAFETTMVNGEWRTRVTEVADSTSDLQVGDIVVAYVATSETISSPSSLRQILERELENGTNQFNFAVTRDGSMWVVAMTYAEGA